MAGQTRTQPTKQSQSEVTSMLSGYGFSNHKSHGQAFVDQSDSPRNLHCCKSVTWVIHVNWCWRLGEYDVLPYCRVEFFFPGERIVCRKVESNVIYRIVFLDSFSFLCLSSTTGDSTTEHCHDACQDTPVWKLSRQGLDFLQTGNEGCQNKLRISVIELERTYGSI